MVDHKNSVKFNLNIRPSRPKTCVPHGNSWGTQFSELKYLKIDEMSTDESFGNRGSIQLYSDMT